MRLGTSATGGRLGPSVEGTGQDGESRGPVGVDGLPLTYNVGPERDGSFGEGRVNLDSTKFFFSPVQYI